LRALQGKQKSRGQRTSKNLAVKRLVPNQEGKSVEGSVKRGKRKQVKKRKRLKSKK